MATIEVMYNILLSPVLSSSFLLYTWRMQTYHGSLALACRGDGRDEGHEACEAVDHARRKGELSIAVRNYHGYLQELCSRAVGHGKPGVTTNLLVLQAVLSTATAATNRQAACSSPPTDSSHCTTSIQVYSTRIPATRTSATEHRTQDTCDRRTLQCQPSISSPELCTSPPSQALTRRQIQ